MTPRQTQAHFNAAHKRLKREQAGRVHAAWLNAQLTAYAPAKPSKFVALDKLIDVRRSPQTPQQRLAVASAWAVAMSKR